MVTVSLFVRLEAKPGKEEELTASSGRGQNARAGETYTSYEHAARGKSKCCQCDGGSSGAGVTVHCAPSQCSISVPDTSITSTQGPQPIAHRLLLETAATPKRTLSTDP